MVSSIPYGLDAVLLPLKGRILTTATRGRPNKIEEITQEGLIVRTAQDEYVWRPAEVIPWSSILEAVGLLLAKGTTSLQPEDLRVEGFEGRFRSAFLFALLSRLRVSQSSARANLMKAPACDSSKVVALDYDLLHRELEGDLGSRNFWLFQCSPKIFRLDGYFAAMAADDWTVTRYEKRIKVGDGAVIWRSGPEAGVVALGQVAGEPQVKRPEHTPSQYWRKAEEANQPKLRVKVTHLYHLPHVIDKEMLRQDPRFDGLLLWRNPRGTNFSLQPDHWAALVEYAETMGSCRPDAESDFAADSDEPPTRVLATTRRIIRDTATSGRIKRLYDYTCQVCGTRLTLSDGSGYAETHHVRPLGGDHGGHDDPENMLCLCPNHHALFDYGAMMVEPEHLTIHGQVEPRLLGQKLVIRHRLDSKALRYHARQVYRGSKPQSAPFSTLF